ncbi:MAG: NFYB/HAP3 family transcription factor subunit [Candidatus Aenigmarchaeota archaeon]|nr:NFYB/HAP3 family transcription factor subunit [Candidatus Aenigmarchaeota archaeon]
MSKKDLPIATVERILKKAGAKRVSKKGAEAFAEVLAEYVYKLSKEAAMLAEHAGRKTMLDVDVRLAKRRLEES